MMGFHKRLKYVLALSFLLTYGCTTTSKSNSVIETFENAAITDLEFSYTYAYSSDPQNYMSDYIDLSTFSDYAGKTEEEVEEGDPWYRFYQMAETVLEAMKDGLSSDLSESNQTYTNESDLLFMYKLEDGAQLYIYKDGSVKTIDSDRNRIIYENNEQMTQAVETAVTALTEYAEDSKTLY